MISEETLQMIAVHTVSSATRKSSKAAQQQKDLQTQDKCKTTSLSVDIMATTNKHSLANTMRALIELIFNITRIIP